MRRTLLPGLSMLMLLFASLACSTGSLSQAGAAVASPQPVGHIIFRSDRNGNPELYFMDIHGNNLERLTNNTANDDDPAYIAPSGQIGFDSDRTNHWNIYQMDVWGNNVKAVTHLQDWIFEYPAWSPDGTRIAVPATNSCPEGSQKCPMDIYTLNADGTDLTNLTSSSSNEMDPAWSPDGQRIAFSSDRDGDPEIYVMNKDGSYLVRLTDNAQKDYRPRWSPDGKHIAFMSNRDGNDYEIYIMNADGSNVISVTNNRSDDYDACWSPDGHWLVYVGYSSGASNIYIVDTNGMNQRRLTNDEYQDDEPVWIP